MPTRHLFAFIGSLILILGIGGGILFRDTIIPLIGAAPPRAIHAGTILSTSAVSIGHAGAKVTVVEFLDFQCPFCRAAYPTLLRLMKEYQGKSVRFVFRHFPLVSIHPFALAASNASLCANEQKTFLRYYDLLYTRQDEISQSSLVTFAGELGLDLKTFNACMAEKRYETLIRQDVRDGLSLGIEGTPTWFVNDVRLVGALPYETFKTAIDQALQK